MLVWVGCEIQIRLRREKLPRAFVRMGCDASLTGHLKRTCAMLTVMLKARRIAFNWFFCAVKGRIPMKSLKPQLLAIVCMLVSLCSPAWASFPTLSYDTVTAGTISSAAQTNTYIFSANANDVLDFTVLTTSSTSGSLWPCIQVYDPGGTPISVLNSSTCPQGGLAELNGLAIQSAGTYTLTVQAWGATNTGSYDAFLQRTDGPVGSLPLPLEQVQTGNIGSVTQSNAYTFSANANDVFNFNVVATSGNLWPCLEVYNAAGTPVTTPNSSSCPEGGNAGITGFAVPSAGTYSLIITAWGATGTGNYSLFLQRTDGPPNPITLPYDTVTAGTISAATQTNNYTFSANANDILNFTVLTTSSTSGSFWPCIQVFNPQGTPISVLNSSTCPQGGLAELNGLAITTAGTYTLAVEAWGNTNTGSYDVFLQRTDNPVGALPLPLGEVETGDIGSSTQSNAYVFSANANDEFNFTVAATSGNLWPCLEVYNSAGTGVTVPNSSSCPEGGTSEIDGFTAPSSGTYSLIMTSWGATGTGNYNLFLQRPNDPANPINIDFDQVMTGAISAVAQSNVYTFSGTANDTLNFTVIAGGNLWPCLEVYNSAGMAVTVPDSSSCPEGGTATLTGFTVPSTGTYNVFLKAWGDRGLGNYNMSVQCFGTCLLPSPTLALISPTSVLAGSGGLTLTVAGSDFVNIESNSVVQWDGVPLSTSWVSLTQMTATVPAADIALYGTHLVTVYTPAPGGGTSASIPFTVNNPVPTTTSPLSPASAIAGGPGFTLTVNGSNFVPSSQVLWNSNSLAIISQTATKLQATVPAGDCAVGGTDTVTIFNPSPGGGTSNAQTFTCNNPAPMPTALSPTSVEVGGPTFTLTVFGSNFVQSSTVNWNGSGLATTYVSASELQATVPGTGIAALGTAQVTVTNPTPGGGTSSPSLQLPIEPQRSSLTSPAPTTTLAGPSVSFTWQAAYNATSYQLWLGSTGVGSYNLYYSGTVTATSVTVNQLPTNGETIYARLITVVNGVQSHNDYTYTAATQALITSLSPSCGSTLLGPNVTFSWTAATGVNPGYQLWLGSTGLGSYNVYYSGAQTVTSLAVNHIPTSGETIYARLITSYNGVQVHADCTYTATDTALTAPAPSSTLSGPNVTFSWLAATGATGYQLWLGSTGVGSDNLYYEAAQTTTSVAVAHVPTNGSTVYARLITHFNAVLIIQDYTYTAATQAVLSTPTPATTLTGPNATFSWTPGTGATNYQLWLGSTGVGSDNLYYSGPQTVTSLAVAHIPTNGATIYVRLITNYNGVQEHYDYTYTAATQSSLTTPTPGSALSGASVTFDWTAAAGATSYQLWLGSTGVGSYNLYYSGTLTGTSAAVNHLPTNGTTIYARLITNYSGVQVSADYTYTAQ